METMFRNVTNRYRQTLLVVFPSLTHTVHHKHNEKIRNNIFRALNLIMT